MTADTINDNSLDAIFARLEKPGKDRNGEDDRGRFWCPKCKEFKDVPVEQKKSIEFFGGWPRWTCPDCQAKDRELAEQRYHERMEAERLARIDQIEADVPATLAGIGVPPRWRGASFDRCPDIPEKLLGHAKKWADNPIGFMVFTGQAGSGKSWLAVATIIQSLLSGRFRPEQCLYLSERDYLDDLKASFDQGDSGRLLPGDYITKTPILLFDDLGSTRLTDWGAGEVAGLIESRHAGDLATIITTNLSIDRIAEVVDPRVASRIAEDKQD